MDSAVPQLSWNEVSARRLDRSALASPSASAGPERIAGILCGAHAQVLSAAELSLGMRSESATRTDVRDALWQRHSLIKTHGPRGTVHLLPTSELPMWIGALGSLPVGPSPFPEGVRLTGEQTEQVVAAVGRVLDGAELTIDELSGAVIEATGPWAGDLVMPAFQGMWPRWRQALALASHRGLLCYGPNRGRKATYTNPRRFLDGQAPLPGRTAQAQLVERYLYAYGPATAQDFARWLGAPRAWAEEVFRSVAVEGQLQRVAVEGEPRWVTAGDTEVPPSPPRGVRLLPYFDAYVIASRPRERLYPGPAGQRALSPSGQAGNFPVLLIDGVVAGVWHQRRSGRRLHVTVEPFAPLTTAQRGALEAEVERVGAVLEAEPELTVGTVAVGPHA